MKVLVAGATGVLGRPLVRALVAAEHEVTGTSRSRDRLTAIERDGARGVVCDALDHDAVHAVVADAAPDVVVHQLTALPESFGKLRRGSEPTNRLRRVGTANLVDACLASGVGRLIAESIAFQYPPSGPAVADESVPSWTDASEPYRGMLAALSELENAVTDCPPVEGVVLRYGTLYGPGTWYAADGDLTARIRRRMMPIVGDGAGLTSFVHVDDAAAATVRALDHGAPGVYNVVDDEPVTFADLLPALADLLGAKPPRRLPSWLALPLAGRSGVEVLTRQRGATNGKARDELGWQPRYPSWRQGFAAELRPDRPPPT